MGNPKKGKKAKEVAEVGDESSVDDQSGKNVKEKRTKVKKNRRGDDSDSDDMEKGGVGDSINMNNEGPTESKKKNKKDKKKKKNIVMVGNDSDEDDDDEDLTKPVKGGFAALALEDDDDDESDDEDIISNGRGSGQIKSGFAALALEEDDDDGSDDDGEDEQSGNVQGEEKKKPNEEEINEDDNVGEVSMNQSAFAALQDVLDIEEEIDSDDQIEIIEVEEKPKAKIDKKKGKKEKKKKGKDKKVEDDDIDALLAEIEGKKKTKNKEDVKKPADTITGEGEVNENIGDEDEQKSKAAKKKEKKQKQKKKEKEAAEEITETNDQHKGDSVTHHKDDIVDGKDGVAEDKDKVVYNKDGVVDDADKLVGDEHKIVEVKDVEDVARNEGEEDEGEDQKKKKKDKKKKKGEKEEKEDRKKPGKSQIKAMQEALKKMEEDKKKMDEQEDAKIKAAEEAEERRLEMLRQEAEKKEKKRVREKERKARLKAEGKLMSKADKLRAARGQQLLEARLAQGIQLPVKGEEATAGRGRGRPKYEVKKRKPQQQQQEDGVDHKQVEESEKGSLVSQESVELDVGEVSKEEVVEVDEVKESWEDMDIEVSKEDEKEDEGSMKRTVEKTDKTNKEPPAKKAAAPIEKVEEEEEESSEDESDEEEESEESSDVETDEEDKDLPLHERQRRKALTRIKKRKELAERHKDSNVLRSPVVCVLGHVDTGKTKILDKIRRTHVQDGEAGGITQQIGATMIPGESVKEKCSMVKWFAEMELKIPGLLVIDTPGHESFSNLRDRGSSLCDIAILVVDVMHGLEPQTIESLNLLRKKDVPFVVALNKIDRLIDWKPNPNQDVRNVLKKQGKNTQLDFEDRLKDTITQFAEQGLNACLYWDNKDPADYISLVPTSAHSGDGMGNLMAQVCSHSQNLIKEKLIYSDDLRCIVMEVKALPGLGTTVDVILVTGELHEGDTLIVAGVDGPTVTQIRGLLMPQPLKELRVKNPYLKHKVVKGAQGIKVLGKDLDKVLAGLPAFSTSYDDEVEIYKEEVAKVLKDTLNQIRLSERGVYVQASTLGSLEALLQFLKTSKIPYSGINIGPVHKRDVMKASTMLEHEQQYAIVLAFDVKVERDAQEMADSLGVRIFTADIIYHLFDKFTAYQEEYKQRKRDEFAHLAVFPCKLRILPQFIFNSRDPIVMGVNVEDGQVKINTPLVTSSTQGRESVDIGIVTSIEMNHKQVDVAKRGQEVCIKIEPRPGDAPRLYGRHFEHPDILISKISRDTIDVCKQYFRDEMTKADWQLIIELKKHFSIL